MKMTIKLHLYLYLGNRERLIANIFKLAKKTPMMLEENFRELHTRDFAIRMIGENVYQIKDKYSGLVVASVALD